MINIIFQGIKPLNYLASEKHRQWSRKSKGNNMNGMCDVIKAVINVGY